MSDFAFNGFENFEITDSKRTKKSSSKFKGIKIFIAISLILLVCELCVYLFIMPCMNNVNVNWTGLKSYSSQSLSELIKKQTESNLVKFNTNEVEAILSGVSGIEEVKVYKKFPDSIYINVVERSPVAMTFVTNGEETSAVQIDKNGVLFTSNTNYINSDKSIPLISGIPVENIPEGMRIPQKYRALMEQIAEIRSLSQNYFAAVSEIHVMPKEYGNYELVLYPIHSRTRILTGRQLTVEALQYMMVALDVVNTLEPNVVEIDMRYGSVSYRTKSEQRSSGEFLE